MYIGSSLEEITGKAHVTACRSRHRRAAISVVNASFQELPLTPSRAHLAHASVYRTRRSVKFGDTLKGCMLSLWYHHDLSPSRGDFAWNIHIDEGTLKQRLSCATSSHGAFEAYVIDDVASAFADRPPSWRQRARYYMRYSPPLEVHDPGSPSPKKRSTAIVTITGLRAN